MIYTRNEISNIYNSTYQINKAIRDKKIFKLQNGIYSDEEYVNPLLIIEKKYPNAIFTMDSAFYYWNLTDVVPEKFHLATKRKNTRYKEKDIKQYYVEDNLFELGSTFLKVENAKVKIYDKERMLIELIRRKNQIPVDFYKEIILNYRKITNSLDSLKISEYISNYKNEGYLYNRIQSEVY